MSTVLPQRRDFHHDSGNFPEGGEGGAPLRRPRAVFVTDFLHVPFPFEQLAERLRDPSAPWLDQLAEAAPNRYTITTGEPRETSNTITVPMEWMPSSLDRLLPRMEADIQLSPLDHSFSRLGISGRYYPPLASLGLTIDRVALHRVAEASVRKFLLGLENALVL